MSGKRTLTLFCLCLAAASAEGYAADIEAGRRAAQEHCSRCHVIGDYNPTGGISSTPSFQLLVNGLKDYRERFASFFERRPHPSFIIIEGVARPTNLPFNAWPVKLTLEDVRNIAAFAETLKKSD